MNFFADVLSYPVRGNGKYMLLTGAVIGVLSELISIAPIIGALAGIVVAGYFCAIYFCIIHSSATGSSEAPLFPETSNLLEDILSPLFKVIITMFVSVVPLILFAFTAPDHLRTEMNFGLMIFLGAAYFPMAMLAVSVLGYIGAASPHIVLPGIVRAGWLYWVGVLLLYFVYFLKILMVVAVGDFLILGSLVSAVVGMYVIMLNGRILGILYRDREEELGWV